MSRLDDLQPNAAVRRILPNSLVTVVSVQRFGSEALELTYKTAARKVANELLYPPEPQLEIVERGGPWNFDGDGFEDRFRNGVHTADSLDPMRRMMKESMLEFDGTPLFPDRTAYTVPYKLSNAVVQAA